MTKAGHLVRSHGEKVIADFLYEIGIPYSYEIKLHGLRPDFYLSDLDIVIEYFGMATLNNTDGCNYRIKMVQKMQIYEKKRQHVIPVFSYELEDNRFKKKIAKGLMS